MPENNNSPNEMKIIFAQKEFSHTLFLLKGTNSITIIRRFQFDTKQEQN